MNVRTAAQGVVLPVLVILLWEIGGRSGWWHASVLPRPADVLAFVGQSAQDGSLWQHLGVTLSRLGLGFVLGVAAAVLIGFLTGFSPLASRMIDPLIQGLRAIPSLAWVPLFLVWLGIGEQSKVTLIAVGVFFPIYLNLVAGIRGVDRKLVEVGRIYGLGTLALIARIILPAAMPGFLTGLRGGLGLGWMFVVAAELIGASQGLGFLLDYGRNISRPEIILGSIVLFAILGKLSDWLLVCVERRALAWRDTFGERT